MAACLVTLYRYDIRFGRVVSTEAKIVQLCFMTDVSDMAGNAAWHPEGHTRLHESKTSSAAMQHCGHLPSQS